MINVFLDSNVWNFLFEREIDLAGALPSDQFCLYRTREVELENGAINPSVRPEKAALKAFIEATIAKCSIRTDTLFGFYDPNLPVDEQRVGGFGFGRFASHEDYASISRQVDTATKRATTPLYRQEADIGLAARAARFVVLSLDCKPGPLNDARQRGGKVVFLTDFDNSGLSLGDFILQELDALPP